MQSFGTRGWIVRHLSLFPGATISELAPRSDLSWEAVRDHVRALRSTGQVIGVRMGRRTHLFPAPFGISKAQGFAALAAELPSYVFDQILQSPGLTFNDLQRESGLAPRVLSRWLRHLVLHKLVEKEPIFRNRRFYPAAFLQPDLLAYAKSTRPQNRLPNHTCAAVARSFFEVVGGGIMSRAEWKRCAVRLN